ncbi:MAG TPA: hypothetical protein VGS03_17595 [Candidatus Polarisedimenticolia bacterium]|jgi:hypothetical protein|nr:hypothetical protein [Candidatus Polarisedimenticolia bacterium]
MNHRNEYVILPTAATTILFGWSIAVAGSAVSRPASAASDDAVCTTWSSHPDDAAAWIDVGESLLAGKRLSCVGAVQQRALGGASSTDAAADPRLVVAAAREALALTWAPEMRARALRLAVDGTRPRLIPCPPKHVDDCPSVSGDPDAWSTFRALFIAETGAPPEAAASLARSREAAAKLSGWVEPGTSSTEACTPAAENRPAVDVPPTDPQANCGAHGYRVCPVAPKATWVHIEKTYCEHDVLKKATYADENGDGVEDASLWIRYGLMSDEEVVGNITYLDVVDGRTGRNLIHGLVAATATGSDGGAFALTAQRIGPGRLRLKAPAKVDHATEVRLRRAHPEFLAPGAYVLGPNGFHRVTSK